MTRIGWVADLASHLCVYVFAVHTFFDVHNARIRIVENWYSKVFLLQSKDFDAFGSRSEATYLYYKT